ncbi:MAG TPA: GlsB/YeaQ/YmgE family stress response membrane protein [Devosia sp.]|nr:GlsB/YeaQ/YmgE family stress response membrane protein [Devosia sp.]
MSPDLQSLLIFLVTGLVAGWIASLILGGKGLIRHLVTGVIGALVGGYVLKLAHVTLPIENSWANDLATAVIGAIIVIVVARVIVR